VLPKRRFPTEREGRERERERERERKARLYTHTYRGRHVFLFFFYFSFLLFCLCVCVCVLLLLFFCGTKGKRDDDGSSAMQYYYNTRLLSCYGPLSAGSSLARLTGQMQLAITGTRNLRRTMQRADAMFSFPCLL
jgi:hypothetical protein